MLRQVDDAVEVISNGVFLMDSRDGRSERLLVDAAVDAHPAPRRLLVGGLGIGFSLRAAVDRAGLERIVVVEIEQCVVDWHASHLARYTRGALSDPRVEVVVADVREHLAAGRGAYDVVCLDVDNGPDWTVTDDNAAVYGRDGLADCVASLGEGGVLAVWSAGRSPAYETLLREHLDDVQVLETAVRRGEPDVVYLARR